MSDEVVNHQKTGARTKLAVEKFSTFQLLNRVVGGNVLGQRDNLIKLNVADGAHELECGRESFLIHWRLMVIRIDSVNIVLVDQRSVVEKFILSLKLFVAEITKV